MSCCDNSAIFEEWRTITNGSLAEARGAKQNQIVRRKRAERKLAGNPSGLHPGLQFENFAMAEKRKSLADLLAILQIQKKKDLKRHCRLITILQSGLAGLIYAAVADVLPWSHHAHHREFVPDHLHLTDGDLGAFAANDGGTFKPAAQTTAKKITAIFAERRLPSGHIFFTPDQSNWHLFYFDQRDFADRNNHWEGGSHIHLINHLWPEHTAQSVWERFRTGNPQMGGALHIKFKRTERSANRPSFGRI